VKQANNMAGDTDEKRYVIRLFFVTITNSSDYWLKGWIKGAAVGVVPLVLAVATLATKPKKG
jgi:hypothetical protein